MILIKVPSKLRQADSKLKEIKPIEVLISLMALSRYNGINSLVTMNTLQLDYNISEGQFKSKPDSPKIVDYLYSADNKSIIKWINRADYKDRNSPILVEMVEDNQYINLDYKAINKILKSDFRIDVKAITLYTYIILVSKAGFRNFKEKYLDRKRQKGYCFPSHNRLANHINGSLSGVKSAIKNLENLNLIEVIHNGHYKTVSREGLESLKQYPNSYIIKQKGWQKIKEEAIKDFKELDNQANKDKVFSQYISTKKEDTYNENRPMDRETEHLIF